MIPHGIPRTGGPDVGSLRQAFMTISPEYQLIQFVSEFLVKSSAFFWINHGA
jgi:hypothetical protein